MVASEPTKEQDTMKGKEASSDLPFAAATDTWYEANQRYLTTAFTAVRSLIEARLASGVATNEDAPGPADDDVSGYGEWTHSQPPALEQLCSAFELSAVERSMLLLAAGAEMDSRLSELFASVDATHRALPTLKLALTTLPDAHWSAISPGGSLRRWQLIELLPADTLTRSPFRLDERILHFLAGVNGLDQRLHPILHRVPRTDLLPRSCAEVAMQVVSAWTEAARASGTSFRAMRLPLIELCGSDAEANRNVAACAAAMLDLCLYALSPTAETCLLRCLLEREAVLSGVAFFIEPEELPGVEIGAPISSLMESLRAPLILSARQPLPSLRRPRAVFHTARATRSEQAEVWRNCLKDAIPETTDLLVSQFNLSPVAIRSAIHRTAGALCDVDGPAGGERSAALWDACRTEARPRLEGLAQRIDPIATWNNLVLPERETQQLRHIAIHVRQRTHVYEKWGFREQSSRGLGISALFAGPSGTGKTTAAEVLANELRLDLFRVDLSQVISKYIGETEKNLSRVFDAAEEGAAVLLFDEADALFGKRTEVKDSHDRYANIEVSYLLQRMEAYRGVAILTTNRKSSLDQAFLRRIRFVVEFPFPEAPQRAEIWRHIFPPRTPVQALNIDRLARLRVSGGNIHNIAMGAAFLAADAGQPVQMKHVLSAARSEFAKLETPLNDAEVAGWI